MNTSRWLNWRPKEPILRVLAGSEPTKPTEPGFDGYADLVPGAASEIHSLEEVFQGRAVELYLVYGDRLFIVADQADAANLGKRRGAVTTVPKVSPIVQVKDPSVVDEVRRWKREFDASRHVH